MAELEALDDDVLALLRASRDVPEIAPDAKAALFAAVASRVAFVPPAGDGGGTGGGGAPAATSGAPAAGGAGAAGAAPGGFALVGGKAAAALLGMFAIGIATGVTLDRQLAPPADVPRAPVATAVAPPRPAISDEAAPAVPVGALPAAPARPVVSVAAAASNVAAPPPSSRGLAAERALLDVARGALARGEANEALVAAGRHASEYPNGSLVEEREAIAIKALVALGRRDEARARAAEMERRFPNGLMLRAVKGAVEAP
jgi:hypothetical protein